MVGIEFLLFLCLQLIETSEILKINEQRKTNDKLKKIENRKKQMNQMTTKICLKSLTVNFMVNNFQVKQS